VYTSYAGRTRKQAASIPIAKTSDHETNRLDC
jgi:hypothetical protein